jgi:excinuclease UvrABC nuclease subunit
MMPEKKELERLFTELLSQQVHFFPKEREQLTAPSQPGVYVIRKDDIVLHVGRTLRGRKGLYQRLKNHLHGSSSFVIEYLNKNKHALRDGYHTYQFLVVEDTRIRALLEAYTTGMLCPKHIGLGE